MEAEDERAGVVPFFVASPYAGVKDGACDIWLEVLTGMGGLVFCWKASGAVISSVESADPALLISMTDSKAAGGGPGEALGPPSVATCSSSV